jgi:(E)-4-hydroxy-3-methylbut-2-enyl-diphosphate synthase
MHTRVVKIGNLLLGGDYPVVIQSMWKEPLRPGSQKSVPAAIEKLKALGCGILRFAVPDVESAEILGALSKLSPIPLVADIHFDWRIALRCLDFPIAKIRINPGNIGSRSKVEEVVRKAQDKGVPIRIGVNGGSLPRDLRDLPDSADALVQAAEREMEILESLGFQNYLVSMKSSDVEATLAANRRFAARHDVPLHLGVTEAGPLIPGVVRNAVALHSLLAEGVGATLRVSLSDTMENEVIAGREILAVSGGQRKGVCLVSCPRCGRSGFDVHGFLARWQERLYCLDKDVTIAVMGCAVNGPEEARHADLGITGAGDNVIVFSHGKIVRTISPQEADTVFEEELSRL